MAHDGPNTNPQDNWKGLASNGADVVHQDLRPLARKLEGYLETMVDSATAHLTTAGSVPASAYGQWDAATGLAGTVTTTHRGITAQHISFVHALRDMVHRLHVTMNVYDEHEQIIDAKINRLDQLLKAAPRPSHAPSPLSTSPKAAGPSW
ncbi:hypothetical protein DZF91_07675 [Actinomadura logoneensis]|uniref:Uncharacterized protein n=1 Tax=Actinomadura logoneensis TaxID=2293572 RepID=A0A372JQJ4_9ACTN|nr:hypothetical protein [Actinomadura logoneensis]RFU42219.1 hypothetical protein DZF91_07675 [Actinomadura logoneensis]